MIIPELSYFPDKLKEFGTEIAILVGISNNLSYNNVTIVKSDYYDDGVMYQKEDSPLFNLMPNFLNLNIFNIEVERQMSKENLDLFNKSLTIYSYSKGISPIQASGMDKCLVFIKEFVDSSKLKFNVIDYEEFIST